jgi:ribosomal protein S18 acetylase RimI-like enzyme
MQQEEITIVDVPREHRDELEWILDESFEGWYLMHSKRTLPRIELVRAAMISGKPVGLTMLKMLNKTNGYVFYIAVARIYRRKGIGKMLLQDALTIFHGRGMREIFASVEEDNAPSEALFTSEGFTRTSFREVAKVHGHLHALSMYEAMWVVPGEVLLHKILN